MFAYGIHWYCTALEACKDAKVQQDESNHSSGDLLEEVLAGAIREGHVFEDPEEELAAMEQGDLGPEIEIMEVDPVPEAVRLYNDADIPRMYFLLL